MIYIIKQEGLCQNKVNSSLIFTCNCKMGYSTPEKIANIWWIERDGMSAKKFEEARLHFLSEVFAAVPVVVA